MDDDVSQKRFSISWLALSLFLSSLSFSLSHLLTHYLVYFYLSITLYLSLSLSFSLYLSISLSFSLYLSISLLSPISLSSIFSLSVIKRAFQSLGLREDSCTWPHKPWHSSTSIQAWQHWRTQTLRTQWQHPSWSGTEDNVQVWLLHG